MPIQDDGVAVLLHPTTVAEVMEVAQRRQDHAAQVDVVRTEATDGRGHAGLRRRGVSSVRLLESSRLGDLDLDPAAGAGAAARKNRRRIEPSISTRSPVFHRRIERWTRAVQPTQSIVSTRWLRPRHGRTRLDRRSGAR